MVLLPLALLFLSFNTGHVPMSPWNEEKTDSLGPVATAHSMGEVHSSIHYDITKLLAVKMGLSPDTAEIIARFCALVDQINPKPNYPYTWSLNNISIPDTFPGWNESLAGTERGGLNNNSQNEFTAQYWHFAFRDPADTLTGPLVWGDAYPEATDFDYYTGPTYFWRVPITYNLHSMMQWAFYNGGLPGLPDTLAPVQVKYADATSSGYQLVQPNSIQAFAIFLHSLADSYSHEECMVHDTLRAHPSEDPYCGLTYHSGHEFAYDTSMRAKKHADSCMHAIWRSLREFKRVHGIISPSLWTTDNHGFQDGDGIPDQLEDDGDSDNTETFLERWKNPSATDLNGDGLINHSDHTTWRIMVCNAEIGIPPQPGQISGPASVCQNATNTYTISPVTGATSYNWTLPSGWSGASTSNSIIATAGVNSGIIRVSANNSYGPGPSQTLNITVVIVPSQTVVTGNVITGQTKCYHATQTITVAGNNNSFTVRNGASATMVAGQKISYLVGTKVISGGYMLGYITPGACCAALPSAPESGENKTAMSFTDKPSPIANPQFFKVYPNPTSGEFVLEIIGDCSENFVNIEIFGMQGESVLKKTLPMGRKHRFSLSDNPAGIYLIRVVAGNKASTAKIVRILTDN